MRPYHVAEAYEEMTAEVMPYAEFARIIAAEVRKHLPESRHLLEIACGTGSLTLELARQDFEVAGLDYSPEMLELARRKAVNSKLKVPFYCQDMRQPFPVSGLDAVTCFYGGLNFLDSGEDLQQAFYAIARSLKSGGLLIFDQFQPETARQLLFTGAHSADYENCFVSTESECDENGQVTHNVTFFLRQSDGSYRREDEKHLIRLHPFAEIINRMEMAGLELVSLEKLYPRLDDSFFEGSSLFIARKK